jgi:hypothetical protein
MDAKHLSPGIEVLCNAGPVLKRQSHGLTTAQQVVVLQYVNLL